MGLFIITVPKTEPTTVLVWNRIYRVSFPFVVLAALLIPYTSANEFVSSLSLVESAQFFFIALLITGCFVVCRTTGVGYAQLFSYAMLVYNGGFLLGNAIAAILHDVMPLNDWYFGLMGIAIFLLLTVVTFNTNGEKYAKTAWGILPKETPKALYARNRERRCNELADAHGLTARERETLLLLAQGKRPKQISEIRTVSIATVRTHVQGVYSKLGVHSADELDHLVRSGE
ncbi:helix-turn-helix transcriptional regulator [Adlercreutzia aquisgranensis]|uniref:helix-turn-helix transcriptional regulator n=1 Tax=Adlercreutzia aquisgranensis TaxID=2941323 RepID=UPI00203C7BCA|nr:helix-turn-helix transcriptional regulator [Adlercreutzia aquisgranensis]